MPTQQKTPSALPVSNKNKSIDPVRSSYQKAKRQSIAKQRNKSFASGEIAARMRRVSRQESLADTNRNSVGTADDLEPLSSPHTSKLPSKGNETKEVNSRNESRSRSNSAARNKLNTANSVAALSTSRSTNSVFTDGSSGGRSTLNTTTFRSRRSSAPDMGTLGDTVERIDLFANWETDLFRSPTIPEEHVATKKCNVCDVLFDVLDSTWFEAFVVFMVMVLIIVLLIGEYVIATAGANALSIELETTSMVIVSIFLIEMLFKIVIIGCPFVSVTSNVFDTVFTTLAFSGQVSLVATLGTKKYSTNLCAFVRIVLYLVVVLRQNRVSFFIYHITEEFRKKNEKLKDPENATTVQKSLTILTKLRDNHAIRGAQSLQIDWLIDVISEGIMYEKEAQYVEDNETRAFLELQLGNGRSDTRNSQGSLKMASKSEEDDTKLGHTSSFSTKNGTQKEHTSLHNHSPEERARRTSGGKEQEEEGGEKRSSGVQKQNSAKAMKVLGRNKEDRSNGILQSTSMGSDMLGLNKLRGTSFGSDISTSSKSNPFKGRKPSVPSRRTTRFVPSTSRPLRALSVRATQQAATNSRTPGKRKSFVSRLSQSSLLLFDNMDFNENMLREFNLAAELTEWSCDTFKLLEASNGHPLVLIAASLWRMMDINTIEEVKESTFIKFIGIVQSNYINTNTYHNSLHAADVTQTMSNFLRDPTIAHILNETDRFCAVIAAAIHDMGHPGTTNNFGIQTKSTCKLYFDESSCYGWACLTFLFFYCFQPFLIVFVFFSFKKKVNGQYGTTIGPF